MNEVLPISVIVPHCNRSDLIAAAIESIRRQTAPPAEIIVVDDASVPEHREALRKYSPEVRIIYLEEHGGPSIARNAGISAATQPWIAFLDDDDEWLPTKLERQWNILSQDASLSAVAGALTVVTDKRTSLQLSHTPPIMTLEAALEGTVAMLQTTVIRTADLRALQGFDPNVVPIEDREFWIRFTAAGYRAYFDREPLTLLNRRPMKRLTSRWWSLITAQFRLIAKHRALYETIDGPRAVYRARSKCIRRVGLEEGRILGRIIYGCGCVFAGEVMPLLKLAVTGKMEVVPYVKPSIETHSAARSQE